MKNKLTLILALIFITVPNAFALSSVGNGGNSVVCRDTENKIVTAELLDLFEGQYQLGLTIERTESLVDDQVKLAGNKFMKKHSLHLAFEKERKLMKDRMEFLPEWLGLSPVQDSFPILKKKGCKIEQLANYGHDGKLRVDQEIYSAMGATDQAAFQVHEILYKLTREKAEAKNSIGARRLTAFLFAKDIENVALLKEFDDVFDKKASMSGGKSKSIKQLKDMKERVKKFKSQAEWIPKWGKKPNVGVFCLSALGPWFDGALDTSVRLSFTRSLTDDEADTAARKIHARWSNMYGLFHSYCGQQEYYGFKKRRVPTVKDIRKEARKSVKAAKEVLETIDAALKRLGYVEKKKKGRKLFF